MIPLSRDFAEELLNAHLYRLATRNLIRLTILAEQIGDDEYVSSAKAELSRRELTERKAAA